MRRRSIAELSAEVAGNPDSTAAVDLARAYRERGDLERALRLCLRGLERNPTLVSAHHELGCIYWARGEGQLALDEWSTVKRLAPDHLEARGAMAKAYASEGRNEEAMREIRDALAIRPDDRGLQALLAEVGSATDHGAAEPELPGTTTPAPRARGRTSPIAVGSGRAARPRGGKGGGGASASPATEAPFAGVATGAEWMGAVVVDEGGAVVVGGITANGADVGAALASHLAGAPEEANGAASYLGLGAWRTLTVESEKVRLLVEPVGASGRLLIVAAHPETPPGRTLRIREAVRGEAARRLADGGAAESAASGGSADGE